MPKVDPEIQKLYDEINGMIAKFQVIHYGRIFIDEHCVSVIRLQLNRTKTTRKTYELMISLKK